MPASVYLPRRDLQCLLDLIVSQGYTLQGPQVIDGAILMRPLNSTSQLPKGLEQTQAPGEYRLQQTQGLRHFSWANGPQALKPLTFVPRETLWRSELQPDGTLKFHESIDPPEPTAVLGVRGCDLAALALQDQHFAGDPYYQQRRQSLLLIAIDCSHPADTCFCASTRDGPDAKDGFDLALSELEEGFLVRAGSQQGSALMEQLKVSEPTLAQQQEAQSQLEQARQQQRHLPDFEPAKLIQLNQHTAWDEVADACLSCGNCTSVCPSCFCFSESEAPELNGTESSHQRQWDSCFSEGHSYIHGHRLRPDTKGRYRQWLTHKFGSWVEQYGRSGCTGCGRCISWCPVGIDPLQVLTQLGETQS